MTSRQSTIRAEPISVDTGWPFLLASLALLAAIVLIPALDDLAEARLRRDRAAAIAEHREARLDLHSRFLAALDSGDPELVQALAATQLNLAPPGTVQLVPTRFGPMGDASVFPSLEPPPVRMPERVWGESFLARIVSGDRTKRLAVGIGAMLLLIGLMPARTLREV